MLYVLPPTGTTPLRSVQFPWYVGALTMDKSDSAYAGDLTKGIIERLAPGSSTVAEKFGTSKGTKGLWALALDAHKNVYAAFGYYGISKVSEYLTSAPAAPSRTMAFGRVETIAIDPLGTLYVPDNDKGVVAEYKPGKTTPFLTLGSASGITVPYGVATWP